MQEKIFITGGTGFLGSYITRMLVKRGFQVRAMKRATSHLDMLNDVKDQIEWVEGDILDVPFLEDAMEGIDKVYHAAAMVAFDPRDHKRMMKINQEGTANVVNVALHRKVTKLAFVRSIAAFGRSSQTPIVHEKTEWETSKINSQYAISKYLAEQEVWRGTAEGLPAVIINPSIIVGAGCWNDSSCKLFKQVDEGLKFYTTGATGFVDVRDVADILIKLMESNIENQRYILNADNITYFDFFQFLAKYLEKEPPNIKATSFLKGIVWRVEWLRSMITGSRPLITKETARSSSHSFQYKNEKIRNELDYHFRSLETSIQETAKVYQQSKIANKNYGVLAV